MKVLILGIDGYIGWSLACHLTERGHEVSGIDNYTRRGCVAEIGSQSAVPISIMEKRVKAISEVYNKNINYSTFDIKTRDNLKKKL
ncbi:MAG: NAD-dependent epimerase/dehydratase family protein, partial [Planctomycetota bacterium]